MNIICIQCDEVSSLTTTKIALINVALFINIFMKVTNFYFDLKNDKMVIL